jgi:predicted glutamine amidotransferase
MCELLGLAFNQPVSPGLSFRGFRHRADRNPHGWGLAAISPRRVTIVKEPLNAEKSDVARDIPERTNLTAPTFIGHVRAASRGKVCEANTHPFTRTIRDRSVVLAHNGTLDMQPLKPRADARFTPEGGTDSELALCALLSWMEHEHVAWDDYPLIEDFLRDMNRHGDLNLLFSDGSRLYAYHDDDGYNGLCWTHRRAPFSHVRLLDEDWDADLPGEKDPAQQGYVIASRRLTEGEEWREFQPGSLMVFQGGELVHDG